MSHYIRTDEYTEAISSLNFFVEMLPSTNEDKYRWKWAIIALHNAVQGFMVLSLKGTDSLLILPEKKAIKWLNAYYNNQALPKENLDFFLELYKKIQKHRGFQSSLHCNQSLQRLNSFRNHFIHFLPQHWSLEISGIPKICIDCLSVIRHLVEKGEIIWYDKEVQQKVELSLKNAEIAIHTFIIT